MKMIKKLLLVVLTVAMAYLGSPYIRNLLTELYGNGPYGILSFGGEIELFVFGFLFLYVFFLPLFFTAFGDKHKYWWMAVLLIPVLVFEIKFDLEHIYLPIIIGLVGWWIGLGIQKIRSKSGKVI